jgi:alpha-amylase
MDCCVEGDSSCVYFCRHGNEIVDQRGGTGWKVGGTCVEKWNGFCFEDEECDSKKICDRISGSRAGTCRTDERCHQDTCGGHGSCRDGSCTCDWGFAGTYCERSTDAFAFLLYGNSSVNFVQARVLVRSLRTGGSTHDVVAIVPDSFASLTPKSLLGLLEADGVKIRYTRDIPMPPSMASDPIIHDRWSGVMNKFAVWQLTEYSRVAMVDLDIVLDLHSDSPSDLFADCTSPLCAVRDGDPQFINAGVMVITPCERRLGHIVAALQEERHHYDMPEQSFLTRYSEKKSNGMPLTYLDKKWNSCVGGGILFNEGWASSGYNFLHACSWGAKPANVRMCFEGSCDQSKERHSVLVWQQHHAAIDTCIRHREENSCSASAACSWCGHYCSDRMMPCSAALFKEQIEAPVKDESKRPSDGSNGSLDNAPSGWWAWPKTAMYQVLVDRFASSQQQPCKDLQKHCGGNFAGMQEQLAYLDQLGVDGILMSPVVENAPGGYHGYWPVNLNAINSKFGTKRELKDLVFAAHRQRMKVVVDVNLNHAGGPGVEVAKLIPNLKPFNRPEHYHPSNCSLFSPEDFKQSKRVMENCQLFGLPDYNHENPAVWQGLQKWLRRHVDTFGFDGIRIDASHHMPKSFLKQLPGSGPPVPAFHEVISTDTNVIGTYANSDFDSVYNYPLYFILRGIFADFPGEKRRPLADLVNRLGSSEAPDGRLTLNFLDNNDMPRFVRMAGVARFRNALLYVLGAEGVPVLLYGSEQDAQGHVTSNDPVREEPPDQWRPALWDSGYGTAGSTFQMVQRVLWLRKRFNGLHQFKQQTVHVDHEVLVFARGPLFFVVTRGMGSFDKPLQRILWHNETAGSSAVRRCNLLAENVMGSCRSVELGKPDYLQLSHAEPHLDAPEDVAKAMLSELGLDKHDGLAESSVGSIRALSEEAGETQPFKVESLPQALWRAMPSLEVERVTTSERIHRALIPTGVIVNDPVAWQPAHGFVVPSSLDDYAPPLGVPAFHTEHLLVRDACFYAAAAHPSIIYRKDASATHVLCPHESGAWCHAVGREVASHSLPSLDSRPVLHLSYGALFQGGFYHILIQLLPEIATHIPALRAGSMRLFVEYDWEIVLPVLEHLGIAHSAFRLPQNRSQRFGFCTTEMRILRHQAYSNHHPSSEHLQRFREELQLPDQPQPLGAKRRSIVLLSRGTGTRSISNEAELVRALEVLGRPVEVLRPGEATLKDVIATLSRADVVIGVHGANMANMVYAPSGTKVLELMPEVPFRHENHHYRTLAGALSFPYMPIPQSIQLHGTNVSNDPMLQLEAVRTIKVDPVGLSVGLAELLRDPHL